MSMPSRPSSKLTLHDILSRLDLPTVRKILGPKGSTHLDRAGAEDIDFDTQVRFSSRQLRVSFPGAGGESASAAVVVRLDPAARHRLRITTTARGEEASYLRAATLSMVLEEKHQLGLSSMPNHDIPWEHMSAGELEARALAERRQRSQEERMGVRATDPAIPWTDYTVTSAESGRAYRVALRGMQRGQSYCSCPDFRRNLLGVCKHILRVQERVAKSFPARALQTPWTPQRIAVYALYEGETRIGIEIPAGLPSELQGLLKPWRQRCARSPEEMLEIVGLIGELVRRNIDFAVYPDAEEILNGVAHRKRFERLVAAIRSNPAGHPLRRELLRVELLPYQLDGIAFAAGAGRAILADDMGLGKTVQGIGMAELLARFTGIQRVLVVCPASVKSQWRLEVQRFSHRTVAVVMGKASERHAQYEDGAFFTVCNYEQILRDHLVIENVRWDLIILDEAQRIKNWEAKTSRVIKNLRSTFALVLTGTPLENRLEDLYSIMEFIDDRRLGPAYRFIHQHRQASDTGRVTGYRNLDHVRERIEPVLLRRTRQGVALDLPPRSTEIVRILPTEEQSGMERASMMVVQSIIQKHFLTEMDLLRLQKTLLMARMACNSTFLVDKNPPGYSSKLERLAEILETLCGEPQRKMIIFSEWTTMLDLVEPVLRDLGADFVRLDGKVPPKQRQNLVNSFQNRSECRAFLTTNAGSTGLNLQAADTVINLDLPWNPAILEQRIGRAYRMGQKRKVQVYILITEGTIEENMLQTLSAKHELATAVLDPDSNLADVALTTGIENLKRRVEILLGAKPEAEPDISDQQRVESELAANNAARVSEAGGALVLAAFSLIGELLPSTSKPSPGAVSAIRSGLAACLGADESGRPQLTLTLPGEQALDTLTGALAQLMAAAGAGR
ncbi:MAG TPA: DEAD/DEAH box helicase [Verrucomicrobiales bacterium]|nr:DEAD/DEAH box helicase [Verrucomicrobiales bacterium]